MTPHSSFDSNSISEITTALANANKEFMRRYPGESNRRQAVHTVYGGAHLSKRDSAGRLGAVALRSLEEYAPDGATLAKAIGMSGDKQHVQRVYDRVVEKLRREAVEDFRLDFEDGYGNRPDGEEDGHAGSAAAEVAAGAKRGTLPPFIGIRIKNLGDELRERALRTTHLFLERLLKDNDGRVPPNFVVTLP